MKYIYVIGCVTYGIDGMFSFPSLGAYTSESAAQRRMNELKQYRLERPNTKLLRDESLQWTFNGREIREVVFYRHFNDSTETEHLYIVKYKVSRRTP